MNRPKSLSCFFRTGILVAAALLQSLPSQAQQRNQTGGLQPLHYASWSLRFRSRDVPATADPARDLMLNAGFNRYWSINRTLWLGAESHLSGLIAQDNSLHGTLFLGPSVQVMKPVSGPLQAFGRTGLIGSLKTNHLSSDEFAGSGSPNYSVSSYLYAGAGLDWDLDGTFGLFLYGQYNVASGKSNRMSFPPAWHQTRGVHLSIGLRFN